MQPPRLLATLSVFDRYTFPRFGPDALVTMLREGRITADRVNASAEAIGPVGCADLLHTIMENVRPRRGVETLSGTDEVTRERIQVKVAEDMLGEFMVADIVARGNAENALPFIRWGTRATAVAAVKSVNGRVASRYNPPLASEVVKQATDAIIDRGAEDPSLGGPSTIDLAREVRSRALFDEIAEATDRAHGSETPEGIARAARCETILLETLTNPLCQPYGDGARDSAASRQQRAKTLEVTGSPETIKLVWQLSGRDPVEAGAVLDALGRTAIVSYARSNHGATTLQHAECAVKCLTVAELVMRSLGYASGSVPLNHAEAVTTLIDTAIGMRANSHTSASNGWVRQLSASSLMEFNHVATSFLKLTDRPARNRTKKRLQGRPTADLASHPSRRVTDQKSDQEEIASEPGMLPLLDDLKSEEITESDFPLNVGSAR